jgi:hypothetical protein
MDGQCEMKRFGMTALLLVMFAAVPFAQDRAAPDVLGEWEMTTLSPVGESTNTVEFRKDSDTVNAFAKGAQGERPYDQTKVEGDKLTLVRRLSGQPDDHHLLRHDHREVHQRLRRLRRAGGGHLLRHPQRTRKVTG